MFRLILVAIFTTFLPNENAFAFPLTSCEVICFSEDQSMQMFPGVGQYIDEDPDSACFYAEYIAKENSN